MHERVESLKVELKDIAYDLRRKEDDTQFDEGQLQSLQERYDLINRLMMKHHVNDYDALTGLRDSLREKVNAFENIDEAIEQAEKTLKESEKQLSNLAKTLHDKRCQAAVAFSDKVTTLERQLGVAGEVAARIIPTIGSPSKPLTIHPFAALLPLPSTLRPSTKWK